MPAVYQGLIEGLVKQPGESFTQDETGIIEAKLNYLCKWEEVMNLLPKKGSPHPEFPNLTLKSANVKKDKLSRAQIDCSYSGLSEVPKPEDDEDSPEQLYTTYELIAGTSTEPIGTLSKLNLTSEDMLALSLWQNNPDDPDLNGWTPKSPNTPVSVSTYLGYLAQGITDYLVCGLTWRVTSFEAVPPSISRVGKTSSPSGPAPSGSWLLIGVSASQEGKWWRVSREWRAGGPAGWNKEIYG